MELKHYLYRHIRLDSGLPFYIGIGTKPKNFNTTTEEYRRAFKKCDRLEYWKRVVDKAGYLVEIMLESNDYNKIKESEIYFISLYGRADKGKGTLVNHTDGGEGGKGRIWQPTAEHRKKVSEACKKRRLTPEHKAKLINGRKNTPISDESRERYRKSRLGNIPSEEAKIKNSIAHKRGKNACSKKVIDTKTGIIYACVMDAAEDIKRSYTETIRNLRQYPHRTTLRYL